MSQTLAEFLKTTPPFNQNAQALLAALQPLPDCSDPSILMPLIKKYLEILPNIANSIVHSASRIKDAHLLNMSYLAMISCVMKNIELYPGPTIIVIANFEQEPFVKFLNGLRTTILFLISAHDFDKAQELTTIVLAILEPFIVTNIILAHPQVKNTKQKLSQAAFSYTPINMNAVIKQLYSCQFKLCFERKEFDAAVDALNRGLDYHEAKAPHVTAAQQQILRDNNQTERMRAKFQTRKDWKSSNLRHYMPFVDGKNFVCEYYLAWVKLFLSEQWNNYEMAECYLEMHEVLFDHFKFDKKVLAFAPIHSAKSYQQLADHGVATDSLNKAYRYYQLSLQCYQKTAVVKGTPLDPEQFNQQDVKTQIRTISGILQRLKKRSFRQLIEQWNSKQYRCDTFCMVIFDEPVMTVFISANAAHLKAIAKHLTNQRIKYSIVEEGAKIFLSDSMGLAAHDIQRVIIRAEKDVKTKRAVIEKKLAAARLRVSSRDEQKTDVPNPFEVETVPHRVKIKRGKVKKGVAKRPTNDVQQAGDLPEMKASSDALKPISWCDDLPDFMENEGDVYPFPNPEIQNCPIPKGNFFFYIDPSLLEHFDEELLYRFEEQMALGLWSKGDQAQGLRSLSRGEANGTNYIFKINIGAQDLRLYGYPIAYKTIDGKVRTLVCFDQVLPHGKKLLPLPVKEKVQSSIEAHCK